MAAIDYFLRLDGIRGESRDAAHRDEIEVEAFGWGAVASGAAAGAGGGAGKTFLQPLRVAARVSRASPALFLACATGRHIRDATLTARRAGARGGDFLVVRLEDVLVTSYQESGSDGGGVPTDEVALAFARVRVEYRPQKADGSLAAAVKAGWDAKLGKPI